MVGLPIGGEPSATSGAIGGGPDNVSPRIGVSDIGNSHTHDLAASADCDGRFSILVRCAHGTGGRGHGHRRRILFTHDVVTDLTTPVHSAAGNVDDLAVSPSPSDHVR